MRKINLTVLGLLFAINSTAFADALDHWTKVATTPYGSYIQIIYANGNLVAISDLTSTNEQYNSTNGGFSVSPDGLHWQHYVDFPLGAAAGWPTGIAAGGGEIVTTSINQFDDGDSGAFSYSSESSSNTLVVTNSANSYPNGQYAVCYGVSSYASGFLQMTNGLFVAGGYYYENAIGTIYTSIDGQNWAPQTITASNVFMSGVGYGNNTFLAVGYRYGAFPGAPQVFRSSDGTNWLQLSTNSYRTLPPLTALTFVNGTFYGTPYSNSYPSNVYTTTSGTSWIAGTIPYPSLYLLGTYSNSYYVSVHPGYPIATSPDKSNWTTRNTGLTNILTGIAYGSNYFVVCTADGSLYRSDSTVPSLSSPVYSTNGFQMTLTGGIGPQYQIQASTDLVNWSNVFTITNLEANNQFTDTNAANYSGRYYRAVYQ